MGGPSTVPSGSARSAQQAVEQCGSTAFQTQGPDLWHPNPGFLFARGAGAAERAPTAWSERFVTVASTVAPVPLLPEGFDAFAATL